MAMRSRTANIDDMAFGSFMPTACLAAAALALSSCAAAPPRASADLRLDFLSPTHTAPPPIWGR
jgi:hypothetical protein